MMRPITYSLQFRGRASPVGSDRMRFMLTAPSSALVTSLGPDGVHGAFEDIPGGDAALEAELSLHEQSTFDDAGTIEFGHGNSVRFRSVALGRLVECPDRNLKHGTAVCEVEGGWPVCAGPKASSRPTSSSATRARSRTTPRAD